jgi:hypothetical protein
LYKEKKKKSQLFGKNRYQEIDWPPRKTEYGGFYALWGKDHLFRTDFDKIRH